MISSYHRQSRVFLPLWESKTMILKKTWTQWSNGSYKPRYGQRNANRRWVTGILEMNMTDKGWCTLPQSEWNKSIQQIDGDILCSTLSLFMTCYFSWSSQLAVPQFTFHRQCRNRNASGPSDITDFIRVHHQYQCLVKKLSNTYRPERVKSGVLEAMMALPFIEDAPIRIYYESTDSVVWFVLITLL